MGIWLLGGLLIVVIGLVGILVYHQFGIKAVNTLGSPKGRKGGYGISGKVLSLSG